MIFNNTKIKKIKEDRDPVSEYKILSHELYLGSRKILATQVIGWITG